MRKFALLLLAVMLTFGRIGPLRGAEPPSFDEKLGKGKGSESIAERAIATGLAWLATHQASDGGWDFAVTARTGAIGLAIEPKERPADRARASATNLGAGSLKSRSAATALGILPFVAAGQTHASKGPYQKHLQRAVTYLLSRQKANGNLADGDERPHWSHAMATLVLCETFASTRDAQVEQAAGKAIEFLAAAQDLKTGGWRDGENSPSTELLFWHVLAISSREKTLQPPKGVLAAALSALSSAQSDDGARYGATSASDITPASTNAGLAARLYLDWPRRDHWRLLEGQEYTVERQRAEQAIMQRAIEQLAKFGPVANSAAANYYASLFLIQTQAGQPLDTYIALRRYLVKTQIRTTRDESGSWWNSEDVDAAEGGRLMQTALNTLSLETFYRYLSILQDANAEVK